MCHNYCQWQHGQVEDEAYGLLAPVADVNGIGGGNAVDMGLRAGAARSIEKGLAQVETSELSPTYMLSVCYSRLRTISGGRRHSKEPISTDPDDMRG